MLRKIIQIEEAKCNGCGLCAAACHEGAITFEEREASAYDHAAVLAAKAAKVTPQPCGCPGASRTMIHETPAGGGVPSQLRQWPVQLKLVSPMAPYLSGADILIAADCTAFAYGDFHRDFIKGRVTLVGCPKLDEGDYAEKLTEILRHNDVKSITVVRMEVPCCGGIQRAAEVAVAASDKNIPLRTVVIGIEGEISQ